MAVLRRFRALRPKKGLEEKVASYLYTKDLPDPDLSRRLPLTRLELG